ncbi:MAG: tyrosine-type recombinase/integrase [Smithella sp.]
MAGTKQYPGVLKVTDTTYKLTITDGYCEVKDEQGNVVKDEQGKVKKQQKRYFKTVTAKSAKEASDLRAEWITEIKGGAVLTNNRMTLKQFYAYFKEHSEQLAPKSIQFYDGLFVRIEAAIGHKKLDDITPNHIRSFIKNLGEDGIYHGSRKKVQSKLSANTILKYHRMLNMLFNRAVKWGLASFNPVQKTDSPEFKAHQKPIYDEETTGRFLFLLEKEEVKHQLMAMLALSTGARRGEIFGLQWHHIDLEAGIIKIEQTSQYIPGKGIFMKDPKTEGSNRTITISKSIVALLKKHKAAQSAKRLKLGGTPDKGGKWEGSEESEDDFVFTKWNGKPAHPDSMNTWLKKFIDDNNLPKLTPHSFRHMAATYLITSGTDLRTIAGKLGHSNTNTTSIVYSHLLKSAEKETTDKMENFIQQATEKEKEKQKKAGH